MSELNNKKDKIFLLVLIYLEGTEVLRYELNLLGDGKDADAGNGDYDLTKSFFSTTAITP